jgi:threonine dehydratase
LSLHELKRAAEAADSVALRHDYLKKTLTARVYDVARETELERAPNLSARLRNPVYLKREDNQPVFSFKVRGAYNKMAHIPSEALERGVITASAGNHAQGVALSAARMGVKAIIVVPVTTPQVKVDAVRAHGGPTVEVVQFGESYSDAYGHAVKLQEERGLTFVHPFDDPYVIAGQGTVAMEILSQHQGPIHAIFVPIGGGGLAAGVAAYVKSVRPEIKVIGVQTDDSCAMAASLKAGERVTLNEVGLFSDGTAVKLVGEETFRLCSEYLDDVLLVNTDALCAAIKDVFQDTRSVLEPAGSLAVAGAKQYAEREGIENQTLIAITSGANMNFDRMRFVAERAEVGEAREAAAVSGVSANWWARAASPSSTIALRTRTPPISSWACRSGIAANRRRSPAHSKRTGSPQWTSRSTNSPSSTSATWWAAARPLRTTSGCSVLSFRSVRAR